MKHGDMVKVNADRYHCMHSNGEDIDYAIIWDVNPELHYCTLARGITYKMQLTKEEIIAKLKAPLTYEYSYTLVNCNKEYLTVITEEEL